MTRPDYDSDDDPLGYMTTDYPSGALFESRVDMSRRMLVRGRNSPHLWARVATYTYLLACVVMLVGFLAFAITWVVLNLR